MIRIENLTKVFGPEPETILPMIEAGQSKDEIKEKTNHVVGVQNCNFTLNEGEIFVIMGLSGSGKSTLLRCVNRLIEPTTGKVFLEADQKEYEITALDDRELRSVRSRYMSMVFQRFGLFPHRTVLDNVKYGLEIQGIPTEKANKIAQQNLDLVGLGTWGKSFPHELSGGMQQRVGLARALATGAKVLLMDEPFSALDPLIKVNMQDELLSIEEELHKTLLFITHDLDEALRIGDRIAIMDDGIIVQIGTPEEIIVNPQTEYVADFVEHADPTGVITAGTIALSLESELLEAHPRDGGGQYWIRTGYPHIHFNLDDAGIFQGMTIDDKDVTIEQLRHVTDKVRNLSDSHVRRTDVALSCPEDATLREILRGRLYSTLPLVLLSDSGKLLGTINERDVVYGILEKRGQTEEDPARYEADQQDPIEQQT